MKRLRCLFLFTGVIFFSIASTLYGLEAYKQWKNVKIMIDMHEGLKRQMEYYEKNTPQDPYSDNLT